mmetsp:Transcript_14406/g.31539  ORF Transcript_14406/g.31539 Transcript_14406/m.31539 type:complete len:104 (+) Transcript_14406:2222-2533(+)
MEPTLQLDLSPMLELRGVVRVCWDCPVLTAFCVFRSRPGVHCLVAVEGPHCATTALSKEQFLARLLGAHCGPGKIADTVRLAAMMGLDGQSLVSMKGRRAAIC